MPDFTASDWYRFPHYYDVVFDQDTRREADFLEGLLDRLGRRADSPRRASSSRPAGADGS